MFLLLLYRVVMSSRDRSSLRCSRRPSGLCEPRPFPRRHGRHPLAKPQHQKSIGSAQLKDLRKRRIRCGYIYMCGLCRACRDMEQRRRGGICECICRVMLHDPGDLVLDLWKGETVSLMEGQHERQARTKETKQECRQGDHHGTRSSMSSSASRLRDAPQYVLLAALLQLDRPAGARRECSRPW